MQNSPQWANARNILAVRLDNLGDVLMTGPALTAVKEGAAGARLTLLASKAGAAAAAHVPAVDDTIVYAAPWTKQPRNAGHHDTDRRLIFVGAEAWGMDETGWPKYGDQSIRDQVGVFERIGSDRWRLVLPWPKVDSKLEILELVR